LTQLVGDVVGLINALSATSAVLAGWDIGTYVDSYAALLRPDLTSAVVLVSSAYAFRPPVGRFQINEASLIGTALQKRTAYAVACFRSGNNGFKRHAQRR